MSSKDEKFEKDCEKYLPEDWRNTAGAMSAVELKGALVEISKSEEWNQKLKDEDGELVDAKEAFAALGAGYKEATKVNRLKIKFALKELKKYE